MKDKMGIIFHLPLCPERAIALAQGSALWLNQEINQSPERA